MRSGERKIEMKRRVLMFLAWLAVGLATVVLAELYYLFLEWAFGHMPKYGLVAASSFTVSLVVLIAISVIFWKGETK